MLHKNCCTTIGQMFLGTCNCCVMRMSDYHFCLQAVAIQFKLRRVQDTRDNSVSTLRENLSCKLFEHVQNSDVTKAKKSRTPQTVRKLVAAQQDLRVLKESGFSQVTVGMNGSGHEEENVKKFAAVRQVRDETSRSAMFCNVLNLAPVSSASSADPSLTSPKPEPRRPPPPSPVFLPPPPAFPQMQFEHSQFYQRAFLEFISFELPEEDIYLVF